MAAASSADMPPSLVSQAASAITMAGAMSSASHLLLVGRPSIALVVTFIVASLVQVAGPSALS